jgi:peroxiredoxin Q/BCP
MPNEGERAMLPAWAATATEGAEGAAAMYFSMLAMLIGSAGLKTGDRAPDFTLPDTDWKPVTLSKLLGQGPVILAFYVRAFTPG